MPETIIIYFKQYIGPQFFTEEPDKFNYIPINPKSVYSKQCQSVRTQFPLRLSYALTTHKVQGDTLTSGVIDLGKLERNIGSTFVQLFRFKKFTQFLIQPFSLDRLTKIKNHKQLQPRLKEEARLMNLFKNTKILYSNLFKSN